MVTHVHVKRIPFFVARGFVLLPLVLAACGGIKSGLIPRGDDGQVYLPPTPASDATPLTQPNPMDSAAGRTPEEPRPTATPSCVNNLSFLDDLTIPDGTLVAPGIELDKRWQVSNSGTCNWDERYRLNLIAGLDLGASPEQALYPARSGSQADVGILFTAPTEPGTYRSAWQAYSPQGEPFGDPFFIEIVVIAPTPAP